MIYPLNNEIKNIAKKICIACHRQKYFKNKEKRGNSSQISITSFYNPNILMFGLESFIINV